MTRAWTLEGGFGLEHLQLAKRRVAEPGPGEARVRVTAASLNYRDWLVVTGAYDPKLPSPRVPGSDACAVVEAVGPGVTRVAVGDRVMPIFAQGWLDGTPSRTGLGTTLGHHRDGTLAEQMIVDAEGLVRPPAWMTDAEVACLPCAAVTAWNALVTQGGVRAGDVVLVQGSGGVSVAALRIARLHGARVIATTGRADRADRLRALGADLVLGYNEISDWGRAAKEATGGRGVDHVVDVGGAGTLEQSLRAVRVGGTVSIIGVLGGAKVAVPLNRVLMQQVRVQGVIVGSRAETEAMLRAFDLNRERPVIDRTFGFEEVPAALQWLADGRHFGKIGVRVTDPVVA